MTLTLVLFYTMCAATLMGILMDSRRVYQFPWLMGTVFAGFIGPQLYTLSAHQDRIPAGSFDSVVLMSVLCMAACWGGNLFPLSTEILSRTRVALDENRLYEAGIALLAIGTVFGFLTGAEAVKGVRDEYGNMTGTVTIYLFFAGLSQPATAILLRRVLRKPSLIAYAMLAFSLQGPIVAAVYYGRREPTVLTALTIAMTLYFNTGWRPPRLLVLAAIVGTAVFVQITAQYRALAKDNGLAAFQQLDVIELLTHAHESGKAPEVAFAAYCIDGAQSSNAYGLGRAYWNNLVFRFVPAQIVGRGMKDSLQFSVDPAAMASFSHSADIQPGTTTTGLGDAFQQFGYFGFLVFLAMAYLFHTLWYAATVERSVVAQIFYLMSIVSAMRALTHQTTDLPPALVYNVIFLGAAFWWAAKDPRAVNS